MMKLEKIQSKGFLIKVESSENDGDFYMTKEIKVENEEVAKVFKKIATTLFNESEYSILNLGHDERGTVKYNIANYLSDNIDLIDFLHKNSGLPSKELIKEGIITEIFDESDDFLVKFDIETQWHELFSDFCETSEGKEIFTKYEDYFIELSQRILGFSENYVSRKCESVVIYYIPEDCYAEVIL